MQELQIEAADGHNKFTSLPALEKGFSEERVKFAMGEGEGNELLESPQTLSITSPPPRT